MQPSCACSTAARPALVLFALLSSACLVLNVNPVYDGDSLSWDPALLGRWEDADDKASMLIERGEWKSYRIHYVHPIEDGELTGYLTSVGDVRLLDVMPARGEDRGAFLLPLHAVFRIKLEGGRLELTPLSYDWFFDRVDAGFAVPGLSAVIDQRENVLIGSPTQALRRWMQQQPPNGAMFGAAATFRRTTSIKDQGFW